MPGGLSPDAYLERRLRPLDGEHFSAAGMLPYRKTGEGKIEVLVAKEKPWNNMTQAFDDLAWNILGGKRIPRQERTAATTATRQFLDCVDGVSPAPSSEMLQKVIAESFAVWYPMGKFALIVAEVTNENLDDLPEKFAASKPKDGTHEEFRINELGIKKWIKNIDCLEWVSASSLINKEFDLSDLLSNILQVNSFKDFLKGDFDPSALPPAPADDGAQSGHQQWGGGKPQWGGGGGGKKGGGKWDGGKGYGGGKSKGMPPWMKGGGQMGPMMSPMGGPMMGPGMGKGGQMPYNMGMGGKGMPMQQPMQQMAPMYYNQPYEGNQNTGEIQRQHYGEQLYLMVQPLSPNPYFAQKITGMLLELPENELMLNLTNPDELKRRCDEALIVLKEDGLIG